MRSNAASNDSTENFTYTCEPDSFASTNQQIMAKKPKKKPNDNTIARNRKARFDYSIEATFEGGLVLEGWEVKSLREGRVQIDDSYVMTRNGELEWVGGTITPLITTSTHISASPTRSRKILMHRQEIDRLIGQIERKGYTLIPLALYWNKGRVKIDIGLAKGKKEHDKRASIKERDWEREKARTLKVR
jgi:SsrA-binding protein